MRERIFIVTARDTMFFGAYNYGTAAEAVAKAKELIASGTVDITIRDWDGREHSLEAFERLSSK